MNRHICVLASSALLGCSGGGGAVPPHQDASFATKHAAVESAEVSVIQGSVQSAMTDTQFCQVYLYAENVEHMADAFDVKHPDFIAPATPISATPPIATAAINSDGNYRLDTVKPGNYQLVLNCIVGSDIQDESQLRDDPVQYQAFAIPNSAGITPNTYLISVAKEQTLSIDFIDKRTVAVVDLELAVKVTVDFTDSESRQGKMQDMWGTVNRISPKTGVTVMDDLSVNVVRMLGGVNKKVDGKNVPDLDYDVVHYNEVTQSYEYNFTPLTDRIDAILAQNKTIYQIVLDQPPWAFQRGYRFIPEQQKDSVNFRENERVSHYGNSLPPSDALAYKTFLQAAMRHLVATYGEKTVLSWRFRIGSEIETPDHWFGTEQDFIEHFANSVQAIRAVLPDATIGLHTRSPSFLYRNGTITNYKNEPIASFADGLIEYCHDNNIRYDFWGLTDYPFITRADTRDPKTKYQEFFAPLVNHPKWRKGTVIDFEEFSVITKMGDIPGYAYISSDSPQADALTVALTDEFYRHGVDRVFQWGMRSGARPWRMQALHSLVGKDRFTTEVTTIDDGVVADVGAIAALDSSSGEIDIVAYHYNPSDLAANYSRTVSFDLALQAPVGSTFLVRKKLAAPEHHAYHSFMERSGSANWLKAGSAYNRYGAPHIVLNDQGLAEWANYQHKTSSTWTSWQPEKTLPRNDGKSGSIMRISSELPVFSFEKIEIKPSN